MAPGSRSRGLTPLGHWIDPAAFEESDEGRRRELVPDRNRDEVNLVQGIRVSRVKSGTPDSLKAALKSGAGAKTRSQKTPGVSLAILYRFPEPNSPPTYRPGYSTRMKSG